MQMLLLSAVTLGAAIALFVILYKLVQHEVAQGQRVVLPWVRDVLDRACELLDRAAARVFARVAAARPTRATPDPNVAALFRQATRTPLTVTHTNNHLSKMREHKSETRLTPAQQRKLRHQKLEERF